MQRIINTIGWNLAVAIAVLGLTQAPTASAAPGNQTDTFAGLRTAQQKILEIGLKLDIMDDRMVRLDYFIDYLFRAIEDVQDPTVLLDDIKSAAQQIDAVSGTLTSIDDALASIRKDLEKFEQTTIISPNSRIAMLLDQTYVMLKAAEHRVTSSVEKLSVMRADVDFLLAKVEAAAG